MLTLIYNESRLYNHIIKDVAKSVKLYIDEAFDSALIEKRNKSNNIILPTNLLSKIENKDKQTRDEYDMLIRFTAVYRVKDTKGLLNLIDSFINRFGNNCNLNRFLK